MHFGSFHGIQKKKQMREILILNVNSRWHSYLSRKLPLALAIGLVFQEVIHVRREGWACLHHLWVQQQLQAPIAHCLSDLSPATHASHPSHMKGVRLDFRTKVSILCPRHLSYEEI